MNPRNLRFQRGVSPGGKFATVANLTLGNSSDAQEFNVRKGGVKGGLRYRVPRR